MPIKTVLESDIFLVSYPRSGNTWVRNIIAEALYGESGKSLGEIGEYVPDLHKYNIDEMELAHPRVIKSHFYYTKEYKRIIYIVRDPRDVFISYHKYLTQLGTCSSSLKDFVVALCGGDIWPGTWRKHVRSWLFEKPRNAKHDLILIKYEKLLKHKRKYISRIANYLGISLSKKDIDKIILNTSKEQMRKKEIAGGFQWLPENLTFINQATSGNWKTHLSQDMVHYITDINKKEMRRLGYLPFFS